MVRSIIMHTKIIEVVLTISFFYRRSCRTTVTRRYNRYDRYGFPHLSQYCLNTCFPVSTLGVSTPVLASQHLPLKADLCLNVEMQTLRAAHGLDKMLGGKC